MKTFIALLRGINVTGSKPVKMTELKKLFEDNGFKEVQTYIQSGNVIFKYDKELSVGELSLNIEIAIKQNFGYNVPVIIRTPEEFRSIIEANPFKKADGTVADKIYVTFLEDIPLPENVEKIRPMDFLPDRFVISKREIYLDCASGYGTTKLSNTFFENKLKVRATTRNWKTVNTLLQMSTANC